jgi:hypothetical protein
MGKLVNQSIKKEVSHATKEEDVQYNGDHPGTVYAGIVNFVFLTKSAR